MLRTVVHFEEALSLPQEMFPNLTLKRIATVRQTVDQGSC